MSPSFLLLLLLLASITLGLVGGEDLYRTLGVSRSASSQEIRSAYKRMAKKWHPDKNKSPDAHERIMQINKAYEVLSDAEKRHHYDVTGETEDSPNPSRGHTPFTTVYQSGNTFRFHFSTAGHRPRADDVTTHTFFERIIPESDHKLYLLYIYADFCLQCRHVESIWNQLKREPEFQDVGLGSVHGNLHPRVTHHCGVSMVPSVVGVVSGRVVSYRGGVSTKSMKDFLETLLPSTIVSELSPSSLEPFLSQAIARNRPRVILFSPRTNPSLLYKLTAFSHQRTIDFAFVSTDLTRNPGNQLLLSRFGIWKSDRSLLAFKEYHEEPALTLDAYQLDGVSLGSVVEDQKLYLPRLSAPHVFDLICPYPSTNRLCVVLLVPGTWAYNDTITMVFREMARRGVSVRHKSVSFAYLDTSKQAAFVNAVGPIPSDGGSCSSGEEGRTVVVLQRLSSQQFRFDWFVRFCGEVGDGDALSEFLSAISMRKSAYCPPLEDEEAPGWIGRMWRRISHLGQDIASFVSALDVYASTLGSLLFASMVVCVMGLVGSDQEREHRHPGTKRQARESNRLTISRMKRERYCEMVTDSPKGVITLVLMVDSRGDESRTRQLKEAFCVAAHYWQRARVNLCYLCHRSNPWWIPELMKQCTNGGSGSDGSLSLGGESTSSWIDACHSGKAVTVVAIFGAKKQFCIFPEMESLAVEVNAGHETVARETQGDGPPHQNTVGEILGSTLGFDAEDDATKPCNSDLITDWTAVPSDLEPQSSAVDSERSPMCSSESNNTHTQDVGTFSKKFKLWLDRLADGSLRRYQVDSWPEWRE